MIANTTPRSGFDSPAHTTRDDDVSIPPPNNPTILEGRLHCSVGGLRQQACKVALRGRSMHIHPPKELHQSKDPCTHADECAALESVSLAAIPQGFEQGQFCGTPEAMISQDDA
jgi:hypothetical protein